MCEFPRCRRPATYGYIGANICEWHWRRLCEAEDADDGAEDRLLARIGLIRVSGEVIPLTIHRRRQRRMEAVAETTAGPAAEPGQGLVTNTLDKSASDSLSFKAKVHPLQEPIESRDVQSESDGTG